MEQAVKGPRTANPLNILVLALHRLLNSVHPRNPRDPRSSRSRDNLTYNFGCRSCQFVAFWYAFATDRIRSSVKSAPMIVVHTGCECSPSDIM